MKNLAFYLLLSTCLIIFKIALAAESTEQSSTTALTPQLLEERSRLLQEEQRLLMFYLEALQENKPKLQEKINAFNENDITEDSLIKAALTKQNAEIEVKNLQLELQSAEANFKSLSKALDDKSKSLETLQKTPVEPDKKKEQIQRIAQLEDEIALEKKSLELDNGHLAILKDRAKLSAEHVELTTQWYNALKNAYQKHQEQNLKNQAEQEQQRYLELAAELRKQLKKTTEVEEQPVEYRYLLEIQVKDAEERIQQEVRKLKFESIKAALNQLKAVVDQESAMVSEEMLKETRFLIAEIAALKELLARKSELLSQQQEITKKRADTLKNKELELNKKTEAILTKLIETLNAFQKQMDELPDALQILVALETAYKKSLRQSLLQQREFPPDWKALFVEMQTLPKLISKQAREIFFSFKQAIEQTSQQRWLIMGISVLMWLGFVVWARRFFSRIFYLLNRPTKPSFTTHIFLTILYLLHRNAIGITVTGILFIFIWLIHPATSTFNLSLLVLFSWLATQIMLDLLWLSLADNNELTTEHAQFYRRVRWIVLVTWFLVIFTVLGHVLEISQVMRDYIDSLFMLFLSIIVVPIILKLRSMILRYLEQAVSGYWLLVIRLTSLLVPFAVITVSILGVIGYVNLGWIVAKHLTLSLSVLVIWLIAHRLLADVVILSKNLALKHSDYGLLWTQDIIPPLERLAEVALFFSSFVLLFWINGWYDNTLVRDGLREFFSYPLFSINDKQIKIGGILLSGFVLWTVFWLGSWIHQVTYRWFYSGIQDLGARHSLAVFTQYIVVFIGLLITLKTAGIDLTTITVFAGAIGVGIGLGLQDIAKDFISGIFLLVERPLRTGDVINIGDTHEATVLKIGIRSMTIRNTDYQEVIVPNSQVMSNAFTNWTYSNDLWRTRLFVGVSYDDDPEKVMKLLKGILTEFPEISPEPPSQVYLWEFADSSVIFRITYFVSLRHAIVYNEIKSRVLLKIWKLFKEEGISIPYPQRDMNLKFHWPSEGAKDAALKILEGRA